MIQPIRPLEWRRIGDKNRRHLSREARSTRGGGLWIDGHCEGLELVAEAKFSSRR